MADVRSQIADIKKSDIGHPTSAILSRSTYLYPLNDPYATRSDFGF